VPAAELETEALAWAAEFASGAVVAMGLAKQAVDEGLDGSLARGLDGETEAFIEVFGTEDAKTGVASFLEHGPGKAEFHGR
jgi:enoyl-CoA hydratase